MIQRLILFIAALALSVSTFGQASDAALVYSYMKIDSIETDLQRSKSKVDPTEAANLFRKKAIAILEDVYTPEELKHIVDFWGNELGKSINKKGDELGGALSDAIDEVHAELN